MTWRNTTRPRAVNSRAHRQPICISKLLDVYQRRPPILQFISIPLSKMSWILKSLEGVVVVKSSGNEFLEVMTEDFSVEKCE